MVTTALVLLLILYLLVGVALCVRGRLAVKIACEAAIVATFGDVSAWKVGIYRWGLRTGVVVAWPVFWFGS